MQLFYTGKTWRCLPRYDSPTYLSVNFTKDHCSNTKSFIKFFAEIIFPYLKKVKKEKKFLEEQYPLVIMDTFK